MTKLVNVNHFSKSKYFHDEYYDYVMVVARGGQKKDRFHLLRDLWEIMGVVVLLLRKENIFRELTFLPKER